MGKFGKRSLPKFVEEALAREHLTKSTSYYNYWNEFVDEWSNLPQHALTAESLSLPEAICGWTNPNAVPLLNKRDGDRAGLDLSLKYIPEPWWGNSGDTELHCVFLNHNPFSGGPVQEQDSINTLMNGQPVNSNYQLFVKDQIEREIVGDSPPLRDTCLWHKNNRSKQIITGLNQIQGTTLETNDVSMLLSVELIPWHTPDFGAAEFNYMAENISKVFEYCLLFAGNESRRINNDILRCKPLIRTNRSRLEKMLSLLESSGIISGYEIMKKQQKVKEHNYFWDWFILYHDDLEDITFFRIQGFGNSLPGYQGTQDFLEKISKVTF